MIDVVSINEIYHEVITVNTVNILENIRQCLVKILPIKDGRTDSSPLEFVVAFIFSFIGDTKILSIEGLRRGMMNNLSKPMSRSSFWERLSRKRHLSFLELILSELMKQLSAPLLIGDSILKQLCVTEICLVDSTSIKLPSWASKFFPGTGSAAAVKWHTCIDVFSGMLRWSQITSGRTHDRKCFPEIASFIGKLLIMDLGYWDYGLLQDIENAGGFYLSRLRNDAEIIIKEIVQGGLCKKFIGTSLLKVCGRTNRGGIIEVYCDHVGKESILRLRVIGFWNPIELRYHWYVTNLNVVESAIYTFYRLRWQIELMFKGCKQSLRLDDITSGNKNIIKSLLFGSLVAQLISQTILRSAMSKLSEEKKFAVSYQRISNVFVNISRHIVTFLLNNCKNNLDLLVIKIELFTNELFDPNYRNRKSSVARIQEVLNA